VHVDWLAACSGDWLAAHLVTS